MEIISLFWHQYLYIPGFNLLVWIYLNYAFFNLGIAIIILTILIRIALLPFTVLDEKGKQASRELALEINTVRQDFANDPVGQKHAIRQAFKNKKIRPWANTLVLIIQALTLLLLYQIFISGIDAQANMQLLYSGIPRPDFINTQFLGFDLAHRSMFLAGVVAVYLFFDILFGFFITKRQPSKREQIFTIFFPAFVFLALVLLPSVKSIFILTSMVFSSIISILIYLIKFSFKQAKKR